MKFLTRLSALFLIAAMALAPSPALAKWGAWQSLGGKIIGEPSLVTTTIGGAPMLFVAGRGTDNALWWTQKVGNGQWTAWKSAGGIITAPPSCLSRTPGVIDCFSRDKIGLLTQKSMVNGVWNQWYGPDNSPNPALVDGNVTTARVGSDFLTVFAGRGNQPSRIVWTQALGWSKWAPADIPGWSKVDGPFACAQRPTGVNETEVLFDTQYYDVGYEQACVAKVGGKFMLFVKADKGGAFPIPELTSNYAPDVGLTKTAEGLRVYMTFTNLSGVPVKRQYTVGKGWTKFPVGTIEILGGALTSGPSCSGKYCAGRGIDGAVWIVGQE